MRLQTTIKTGPNQAADTGVQRITQLHVLANHPDAASAIIGYVRVHLGVRESTATSLLLEPHEARALADALREAAEAAEHPRHPRYGVELPCTIPS